MPSGRIGAPCHVKRHCLCGHMYAKRSIVRTPGVELPTERMTALMQSVAWSQPGGRNGALEYANVARYTVVPGRVSAAMYRRRSERYLFSYGALHPPTN